uniref:50S ribosomal protein L17 n=1 Tax=Lygus hesperus TaxID=30085 RepID=A0A0A9XJJ4_LYGHE
MPCRFRPGGYTRLLRTRRRRGDNAVMCYVELIDRPNELRPANPVSYEYALAKGLVPPPHPVLPNITEHDKLNIINASPSTSYKAHRNSNSSHWFYRDHWIQNTLYPNFKRSAPKPSPAPKFEEQTSTVDSTRV